MKPTNRNKRKSRVRYSKEEKGRIELLRGLEKMTTANEYLVKLSERSKRAIKTLKKDRNHFKEEFYLGNSLLEEKKKKIGIEAIKNRKLKLDNSKLKDMIKLLEKESDDLNKEIVRISDIGYNLHAKVEEIQDREIERMHKLVDKLENELTEAYKVQDKLQNVIGTKQKRMKKVLNKKDVLWDLILASRGNNE